MLIMMTKLYKYGGNIDDDNDHKSDSHIVAGAAPCAMIAFVTLGPWSMPLDPSPLLWHFVPGRKY